MVFQYSFCQRPVAFEYSGTGDSTSWNFFGDLRELCVLHWLKADYQLDTVSASLLLGQCVRYDLGNIFDPAYTMVCKLPKALLKKE